MEYFLTWRFRPVHQPNDVLMLIDYNIPDTGVAIKLLVHISLRNIYFFVPCVPIFIQNLTTKNVVKDVTPCGSCKNRRFGETYRLYHQGDNNRRARNNVSSN
jgi:hypothetical protein